MVDPSSILPMVWPLSICMFSLRVYTRLSSSRTCLKLKKLNRSREIEGKSSFLQIVGGGNSGWEEQEEDHRDAGGLGG